MAAGNDHILKIRHADCTQVDGWIDFGTISLPINGLKLGRALLNWPRFKPSLAGFKADVAQTLPFHYLWGQ